MSCPRAYNPAPGRYVPSNPHHRWMRSRDPLWEPGDTCDACGNVSSERYPVTRRRNGAYTHKTPEMCQAAGQARPGAEQKAGAQ